MTPLRQRMVEDMIPFGKKPKTLPAVLANEEVQSLLACVKSVKIRTVLATLYAAGLRLQEALHLQVEDIDSVRMTLSVGRGKGNKQRLVPLSPRLLEMLRAYWKQSRSETWLFAGKTGQRPMCSTVIQKACKQAARDKSKTGGRIPFPLSGVEFVRRWSLHILPKGFHRVRYYGGLHPSKRAAYLAGCRALLAASSSSCSEASGTRESESADEAVSEDSLARWQLQRGICPDCGGPLRTTWMRPRPRSWRVVLQSSAVPA